MGFFGRLKNKIMATLSRWREIGEYRSTFRAFGTEAYRSEVVRSCIRPLAEFTSKANARCNVKQIEMLLNDRSIEVTEEKARRKQLENDPELPDESGKPEQPEKPSGAFGTRKAAAEKKENKT